MSCWPARMLMGLLAAFVMLQCGNAQPPPVRTATHTVIIKQMRFDPPQLNVSVGDTIEWRNEDIYSHTATADNGTFDSGLIDPGKAWSMTVTNAGNLSYHCRPHPNMVATIAVSSMTGRPANQQHPKLSLWFHPPRKPNEFHPILVNFTAALLPLAFLSDLLGTVLRRATLQSAGLWMIVYEAVITPLTVAAGWWWKASAARTLPAGLIEIHQWLGTAAAILFVALAAWRWRLYKRNRPPSREYLAVAFVCVLALVYQGSIGGLMVFGR